MTNRLYTGDNLHFLNRLNSESVDLIYLDPPFNSKRLYGAPLGSKAAGMKFKDIWTWQDVDEQLLESLFTKHPFLVSYITSIKGLHGKAMMAYITFMAIRILEMHRILKSTGSIYLHCDPHASHYLKIVMDKIFKAKNFQNEIIWHYQSGGRSKKRFSREHDIILFYSKGEKFFDWKAVGETRGAEKRNNMKKGVDKNGKVFYSIKSNKKIYKYYEDEKITPADVWSDLAHLHQRHPERTGLETQKPLALLRRIIKASSKEGDLVLDPFCGCATTCAAAQQLKRKWIGIDWDPKSPEILMELLRSDAGLFKDFTNTKELPVRTDLPIEKPDSQSIKDLLFKEQKGKCNACKKEIYIENLEIDHIIPKSKGGSDTRENYQLLCGSCNRIKGNRPMEYLRTKIKQRDKLLAQQITFTK